MIMSSNFTNNIEQMIVSKLFQKYKFNFIVAKLVHEIESQVAECTFITLYYALPNMQNDMISYLQFIN